MTPAIQKIMRSHQWKACENVMALKWMQVIPSMDVKTNKAKSQEDMCVSVWGLISIYKNYGSKSNKCTECELCLWSDECKWWRLFLLKASSGVILIAQATIFPSASLSSKLVRARACALKASYNCVQSNALSIRMCKHFGRTSLSSVKEKDWRKNGDGCLQKVPHILPCFHFWWLLLEYERVSQCLQVRVLWRLRSILLVRVLSLVCSLIVWIRFCSSRLLLSGTRHLSYWVGCIVDSTCKFEHYLL